MLFLVGEKGSAHMGRLVGVMHSDYTRRSDKRARGWGCFGGNLLQYSELDVPLLFLADSLLPVQRDWLEAVAGYWLGILVYVQLKRWPR